MSCQIGAVVEREVHSIDEQLNTNNGFHAFLLNIELNLRYLEICLAAILVLKRGVACAIRCVI
jgi:hypothetical protein